MVILRSQNKITDFLMILAWACPFKYSRGLESGTQNVMLNAAYKESTIVGTDWINRIYSL